MADKKIKVQVDVETDVEPSLAQLRLLKKQLKETAAGSQEFINLQRQIDDVQDSLVAARAGAGNFADVLGTLPGPIGAIGGQLSGTVATLKQFSALKISNIQASFVELGNDIVDVVKGIGQLTGVTKVYTVINNLLAKSFVAIGIAEGTAAAGATAFAAALTATGVGAIVVAIGLAVTALIDMAKELYATATGEKELQRAIDATNAALETQQRLFDLNAKSAENRRKVTLAQMRAQGKSEAEIRKYNIDQSYADYQAAFKAEQEAVETYNKNIGKVDSETFKKLQENLDKRQQATKDSYAEYLATGYNAKAEEIKEEEAKNKELAGKRKAAGDARNAERKRELEELKKGLEEARLAALTEEQREFEQVRIKYDELRAQAVKYGADTKVIETAREKENAAIRDKYAKENLDKRQKELADNLALEEQKLNLRVAKGEITEAEFQNKIFEIRRNAIIKNELIGNEAIKKEEDKLNNNRIASLANLQIALQNEESAINDSLEKRLQEIDNALGNEKSKINDSFTKKKIDLDLALQNEKSALQKSLNDKLITQEQFDAQLLQAQTNYNTQLANLQSQSDSQILSAENTFRNQKLSAQSEADAKLLEAKNKFNSNSEIIEKQFQDKVLEISTSAIVQKDLLQNESLKKEKEKRDLALTELQSQFDEEQSVLQTSLQNKTITQEEFDAKLLALKTKFTSDTQAANQVYQQAENAALDSILQKNKDFISAQIDLEKSKVEEKKKLAEEERSIVLTNLQSRLEALDAENQRIEFDFEQDLARLGEQRAILAEQEATELQNQELTEFQKTEIRKKYADARKAISDQEVATEKAAMMARHEINMAYLGLFQQFGSVLGQVAGKNKALAIAGVVIQQAASIGQIIASTGIANAKAVAASPLTFGMPWVAINTVSAALSIASTIAGAVKSIQQINQAASQAGVQGGGGGTAAAASAPPPQPPRVAGAAAPQIQTSGGMNPTTQIAETISGARAPLKAYVVSGEVSSAQALDRRTSRAATFTGG